MYIKYTELLNLRSAGRLVPTQVYHTDKGIYIATNVKTFVAYTYSKVIDDNVESTQGTYSEFTYDSDSNITSKNIYNNNTTRLLLETVTYIYDSNNNIVTISTYNVADRTTSNKTITYSSDGNVTNINKT